jgi:hypothetical protein
VGALRAEGVRAAEVAEAVCTAAVAEAEARKTEEAATTLREGEHRHAEVSQLAGQ